MGSPPASGPREEVDMDPEDVDDLVTWCRICSRWFPVIGPTGNFFQHVVLNHPDSPIGRAVNEALAERERRFLTVAT
jgi:hypothetical protein